VAETEALCPTGITNAKTEGIHRLIKDVRRRACGFRNPDNQRRRVRHFCTRQSRRSTASHEAMARSNLKSLVPRRRLAVSDRIPDPDQVTRRVVRVAEVGLSRSVPQACRWNPPAKLSATANVRYISHNPVTT
jgi:hypothetical protein